MIITEDVFACFRAWNRDAVARAFLAGDEETVVLMSAMNIAPGKITVAAPSSAGTAALEVHTRCCRASKLLLEQDRLQLLELMRARPLCPTPSSSADADIPPAAVHFDADRSSIIAQLQVGLHSSSCWWRMGDVVRHIFKAPRLSLVDSALIRHRCSAVLIVDSKTADTAGRNVAALSGTAPSSKLLLPRGAAPSFFRDTVLPPTVKWMRGKVTHSFGGLTSSTPLGLLRVIFALKRARQSDEGHSHSDGGNNIDGSSDDSIDLVPPVTLVMSLYGYVIAEATPCGTSDAAGVDNAWQRLCADASCHFCGERPRLIVEETAAHHHHHQQQQQQVDEKDVNEEPRPPIPVQHPEAEGTNDEESKAQAQGGDVTTETMGDHEEAPTHQVAEDEESTTTKKLESQHKCFRYTILLSEQSGCSGHHDACPWRALFLRPVLAEAASASPSREMEFELCNIDEEGSSLRVCFRLPEVAKLMECWRRSLYAESSWGEAYAKHPLPAAVRSVIPSPAEPGVEDFLKRLRSQSPVQEALKLHPRTPLFEDCNFWDSFFRVASLVRAAQQPQSAAMASAAAAAAKKRVGEEQKESGTYWEAVYDAGRRCILAAAEDRDEGTAAAASETFTELYQQSLRRDAAGGQSSSPLRGVMGKLTELLHAGPSIVPRRSEALLEAAPEMPQLSVQDQKRVQSFLEMIDNDVKNAAREPPPPQPKPQPQPQSSLAKRPPPEVNNSDSNPKRGGQKPQQKPQNPQQPYPKTPPPHQQKQQQQYQKQKLQQHPLRVHIAQPHHFHQQSPLPSEGILPFPSGGGGGGVLPSPGPVLQKQQQQQQQLQQSFQPAVQLSPFVGHNRTTVLAAENVGVLDDAYIQRSPASGPCRPMSGNFAAERKGGRGGNHRGGRGGGRGRRGAGGKPFQ
ncbi:hypothetical protein DQ04_00611130 [Trypanosoma grayi]|uniref:hypothetical protein n=1 Tax=Trypanosoma grayi TaxID=71804 RepID=UPI0004F44FC1|nr:hypothetical protein DQ04_00611130 [Trypanosoma grayi]KEG14126.1 hypothetical protein DQ04_00611130 [Trypanosoma grayi]